MEDDSVAMRALDQIELGSMERTFEYEKICRLVDSLSELDVRLMAKCYAKL